MSPEEERVRSYIVAQANKLSIPDLVAKVRADTAPLEAAGASVAPARFKERPADGQWSAAEVWTHILDMNDSGARMITGAIESGELPERVRDTISGEARAGLDSNADYWANYLAAREKLLARVLQASGDEHLDVKMTHPQFGEFSWREWLLFMRVHDLDHMRQLQAVAARVWWEPGVMIKVSVGFGPGRGGWGEAVSWVLEAERLGVDSVWNAETWGYDVVTPLAFLAGQTSKIKLGTGIMQVGSRTPAVVAMTALSMASLSGGRFLLGLGNSGPQVIEGWHGVPFDRPVQRLRELVEIVRLAMSGERVSYEGKVYTLPLPGGEGRALRTSAPPANVPIYLATLGPKSLEMTGGIADGWLASSFMPDHAAVFLDPIRRGAERAGRDFAAMERHAGGVVAFSDDLETLIPQRKPGFAFEIGAMGSRDHNFYKDAYARQGYAELVDRVQTLWLDRQREEAAALIPDEFVLKANLLGTEAMVKDRIRTYRDAGITTISASPEGATLAERVETLGRFMSLVSEVNAERA